MRGEKISCRAFGREKNILPTRTRSGDHLGRWRVDVRILLLVKLRLAGALLIYEPTCLTQYEAFRASLLFRLLSST